MMYDLADYLHFCTGQDETSHTTSTEQSSHDQQHRVINLASNVTSFSKKIRQSWFIVETRALLKLALPIVSFLTK